MQVVAICENSVENEDTAGRAAMIMHGTELPGMPADQIDLEVRRFKECLEAELFRGKSESRPVVGRRNHDTTNELIEFVQEQRTVAGLQASEQFVEGLNLLRTVHRSQCLETGVFETDKDSDEKRNRNRDKHALAYAKNLMQRQLPVVAPLAHR